MGRLDAQSGDEHDDDVEASDSSESSDSTALAVASEEDSAADSSSSGEEAGGKEKLIVRVGEDLAKAPTATTLGTARYVMAGFMAVGLAVAYVVGHAVVAIWNKLASTQSVVDLMPWLTYGGEDFRGSWGLGIGALLGVSLLFYMYRRDDVRTFVNEAAAELSKVTWPNKKEVINGTVVVVVASLIAMIYLMLLDRFWGFVTDLVYGA